MKKHEEIGAKIASGFADRMKFPNELKKNVSCLVLYHDSFAEPTRQSVYRFMTEHDSDFIDLLAVLQRADIEAHSPIGRERIKQLEAIKEIRDGLISDKVPLSVKDLAVNGIDLIRLGFPQGPIIGSVLNDIFQEVVSGNLDNDCELIFTFIARKYL
jgi:tRNA nucleotidyltransferase (CCA-adding enzyme)